jgi:hypothetical protein
VFLERELEIEDFEPRYTFNLVTNSLRSIAYTADFRDSSPHVEFYEDFKRAPLEKRTY